MSISATVSATATTLFTGSMIYVAITDLTIQKIRNGIIVFLFAAYVICAPTVGFTFAVIAASVGAAAAVFAFTIVLFNLGYIGAGDGKLATVTALWVGLDHTAAYLIYTALIGALVALGLFLFRLLPLSDRAQKTAWIARLHSRGGPVPYGVAMVMAALVVFPATPWLTLIIRDTYPLG